MNNLTESDLVPFDGEEPRIHDLVLAEQLEFKRAEDIRKLIGRNKSDLEQYGGLRQRGVNHGTRGGRPTSEYFLNEGQALRLCTLSKTERAADITHQVITVYQAWRNGKMPKRMSPAEVMDLVQEAVARQRPAIVDALISAIGPIVGGVLKGVAGKQNAEMEARLETRINDKVEEVLGSHDGRRNWAIDFRSMRMVLNDEGTPTKRRRGLSTQCSNACAKWAKRNGREREWKYEAGGDDTKRIFHIDLIRDWLIAEGRSIIRAHQDRIKGQGTLSLIPTKRERDIGSEGLSF